MLDWMNGLKVAVSSSGLTVEAARQSSKYIKEW